MNILDIIKNSVDFHVHVGPEFLPRKHTVLSLFENQKNKIQKICIKSHCYSTVSWAKLVNETTGIDFFIGSVTLNNFVGGINLDLLYADANIIKAPFVVWLPTIHAENHLKKSLWEIKKEWVMDPNFKPRKTETIKPVKIFENGQLSKNILNLIEFIRDFNCILATGHISWRESELIVEKALSMGLRKVIVTHPIYELIDMPIEVQKRLAEMGAYIEHSYAMHFIDKISYDKIVKQIKDVGPEHCILTSDVGQQFSPNPDEALLDFASSLAEKGLTYNEIYQMLVDNPIRLLK
ncbi:MAG: DUF6282 family protein [Candidatus Bathyarchaeia archaeon]